MKSDSGVFGVCWSFSGPGRVARCAASRRPGLSLFAGPGVLVLAIPSWVAPSWLRSVSPAGPPPGAVAGSAGVAGAGLVALGLRPSGRSFSGWVLCPVFSSRRLAARFAAVWASRVTAAPFCAVRRSPSGFAVSVPVARPASRRSAAFCLGWALFRAGWAPSLALCLRAGWASLRAVCS